MESAARGRDMLEALRKLGLIASGIRVCVVVNDDGFAIAAHAIEASRGRPNAAQMAAVAATLLGTSERALDRLAQGELGRLLVEGENGSLLALPAGSATLALLIDPGASLGHVLFAARKTADEIASILERR